MAAEKLGMTTEDLMAEIQAGKSISEVAKEQGVDIGEIVTAYMEQLEERLSQAVENGKITQEQADEMAEKKQTHEALQSYALYHAAIHSIYFDGAMGRIDQCFYPLLKRDLEDGVLTYAEAQELVDWGKELIHVEMFDSD